MNVAKSAFLGSIFDLQSDAYLLGNGCIVMDTFHKTSAASIQKYCILGSPLSNKKSFSKSICSQRRGCCHLGAMSIKVNDSK